MFDLTGIISRNAVAAFTPRPQTPRTNGVTAAFEVASGDLGQHQKQKPAGNPILPVPQKMATTIARGTDTVEIPAYRPPQPGYSSLANNPNVIRAIYARNQRTAA